MAITDINSEDRLVQATFAEHLKKVLGWDSVYAWNQETFGSDGTLGRADARNVVLKRHLRAALLKNPVPCSCRSWHTRNWVSWACSGTLRAAASPT